MLDQLSPEVKAQLPAELVRWIEAYQTLNQILKPPPAEPVADDGPSHRFDHHAKLIAAALAGPDDELLSPRQVARALGCSAQRLYLGRRYGWGPPFMKLSYRCVRYRRDALRAWLNSRGEAA